MVCSEDAEYGDCVSFAVGVAWFSPKAGHAPGLNADSLGGTDIQKGLRSLEVYFIRLSLTVEGEGGAKVVFCGIGIPFYHGRMTEVLEQEAKEVAVHSAKYTRNHPFLSTVTVNELLTAAGSEKETRHIELTLDEGMTYTPGMRWGLFRRTARRRSR